MNCKPGCIHYWLCRYREDPTIDFCEEYMGTCETCYHSYTDDEDNIMKCSAHNDEEVTDLDFCSLYERNVDV